MSLLDSLKDGYKGHQAKVAERGEARGEKLSHKFAVDYIGGYEAKHKSSGMLTFYEHQIEYGTLGKNSFVIEKPSVREVAIEGKDEVNRRVTVTRLLALGILAFGVKKKNEVKESFITIVLNDGREIILLVKNIAPMTLKAKLSKVYAAYNQNKAQGQPAQPISATDELERLAALKLKGVITQAEFEAKKKQLLGL